MRPVILARGERGELEREELHRFVGIALGEMRQAIGIARAELALQQVLFPGQAQDLDAPAAGQVGVTIEPSVEQHIAGRDELSPCKARFDEGTGQDDVRVATLVPMPRQANVARAECLDAETDGAVGVPVGQNRALALGK